MILKKPSSDQMLFQFDELETPEERAILDKTNERKIATKDKASQKRSSAKKRQTEKKTTKSTTKKNRGTTSEKTDQTNFPVKDLIRASMGWLMTHDPSGVGTKVPTRFSQYQADVAAFWSSAKGRHLHPYQTAIIETRRDRKHCWPDTSRHEDLLPQLKEMKNQKQLLEAEIRAKEPELRDSDLLFDDIESWNYAASKNRDYHKCRRKIEHLEKALYKGSRFERIRSAKVADFLYLAVPTDLVHPHELADGWGLLYVDTSLEVTVVKEAEKWDCPETNKLHLVQNISAAAKKQVLFSFGVYEDKENQPLFLPMPRRRRVPKIANS